MEDYWKRKAFAEALFALMQEHDVHIGEFDVKDDEWESFAFCSKPDEQGNGWCLMLEDVMSLVEHTDGI